VPTAVAGSLTFAGDVSLCTAAFKSNVSVAIVATVGGVDADVEIACEAGSFVLSYTVTIAAGTPVAAADAARATLDAEWATEAAAAATLQSRGVVDAPAVEAATAPVVVVVASPPPPPSPPPPTPEVVAASPPPASVNSTLNSTACVEWGAPSDDCPFGEWAAVNSTLVAIIVAGAVLVVVVCCVVVCCCCCRRGGGGGRHRRDSGGDGPRELYYDKSTSRKMKLRKVGEKKKTEAELRASHSGADWQTCRANYDERMSRSRAVSEAALEGRASRAAPADEPTPQRAAAPAAATPEGRRTSRHISFSGQQDLLGSGPVKPPPPSGSPAGQPKLRPSKSGESLDAVLNREADSLGAWGQGRAAAATPTSGEKSGGRRTSKCGARPSTAKKREASRESVCNMISTAI